MARSLLDKELVEREGRGVRLGFGARIVQPNVGNKRKLDILEDGIMSPTISSLVQNVLTVRKNVVDRARGSITEGTRCDCL